MAALLPMLLMFLLGLWELGRLADARQILTNAAREGARQASTGRLTDTQVQAVVVGYLKHAGLPIAHLTVTVTNLNAPGMDSTMASQFDPIQVSVSLPWSDLRLVDASLLLSGSTQVDTKAIWCSLKDIPYPSPTGPPIE